ncbi:LD-carboxypeptidase LdcB/DacB [Streptococcus caviae]|uniref:LD-carboxypeptidase LdcB/DacB n=1 Tax=Streptococcus sp. 'caviae' TaxID=1915004 RepID=UPI00094B9D1B|nr:LD-carboxypeptidase LdcB/DacB [Streptococcus sp. 'caviae']OLN84151.1 peptidase [Streptococcus sp. 'caviae']
MKKEMFAVKKQRFSIRKYAIGAASVLIGSLLCFGGMAFADEQTAASVSQSETTVLEDNTAAATASQSTATAVTTSEPLTEAADTNSSANVTNVTNVTDTADTSDTDVTDNENLEEAALPAQSNTARAADSTNANQVNQAVRQVKQAADSPQVDIKKQEQAAKTVKAVTVNKPAAAAPAKQLPNQGNYVYTKRTPVKNEARASAPIQFYANAGDKIFYDRVLNQDGYQWLSYVSYSGTRRYAAINQLSQKTPKTPAKPQPSSAKKIPAQGRYTFSERTNVKNEARAAAPTQFYFNKGDQVNYDRLLENDGYQWLSYISYSGIRRYAAISKLVQAQPQPQKPADVKVSGKITIQNKTSQGFDVLITDVSDSNGIRAVKVPVWTDKSGQDDIVWYNSVRQADGNYKLAVNIKNHKNERGIYHIHLYYLEPSGRVQGVTSTQTKVEAPSPTAIPSQGAYTFTHRVNVKNQAKLSARTEFTFEKGEKINYDRVLEAEKYQWLSYISYSGIRRYVQLDPISKTKPAVDKVSGKISVEKRSAQGFTVVVTNVSSTKGVTAVKVPVWSTQNGQDDIVWYDAARQSNNSYKVSVAISRHKNNRGEYNIHLYYVQKDGSMAGVAAAKTTVEAQAPAAKSVTYNGSYYSVKGKYDEIVIVNKKYPLSASYNPGENPKAKAAFVRLRDDMIAKGYNVGKSYSGFRTYNYQKNLYQNYVNRDGQAAADRYSARPGYSEHQTGLTFDLTDKSGNLLEDASASNWLKNNAHNYGFVVRYQPGKESVTGYMPEAWHIRYIGKEAKEIYQSGLSLEEYYGFEGGGYKTEPTAVKPSIPSQGSYRFTKRSSIKAEPKRSSPEIAYYDAGQTVNYDKVLHSDGLTWISYMAFSGNRRYIAIN